jgi:hypothetical protein
MATISVDQYNDDNTTTRTMLETLTISGGVYTQRTDSRVHAYAPAYQVGDIAAITISATLGGSYVITGKTVRWLAYDAGAGVVPAIGATATIRAATGYVLGVWATIDSAPTTPAAAMPTTGFIKFREMSGEAGDNDDITVGGSTIGVANGTDVPEVVEVPVAKNTVPRLGSFKAVGSNWFRLDDTTHTVGQIIKTPTMGGGPQTYSPGIWVEKTSGGDYEFYPALRDAVAGWSAANIGVAYTADEDPRCKFVKALQGGGIQFGESVRQTDRTYAYTWAANVVTVTIPSLSGTYGRTGTVVTVTMASHGYVAGDWVYLHFATGTCTSGTYQVVTAASGSFTVTHVTGTDIAGFSVIIHNKPYVAGSTVRLDFLTGGGYPNGIYTVASVTSTTVSTFTVALTGSGTAGNVSCAAVGGTAMPKTLTITAQAGTYTWATNVATITFTAHGYNVGDRVYLDFVTGTATLPTDGYYYVTSVTSANAFTVTINGSFGASGTLVNIYGTAYVFDTRHGLAIGQQIYLTAGGSISAGVYTVKSVTATRYTVNASAAAAVAGVAVDSVMQIGYVPAANLKTRIPNIILHTSLTATYARSAYTVTVTCPFHGLATNDYIYLDFTSGGAVDGYYQVTVVTSESFQVTTAATGTIASGSTVSLHSRNAAPNATLASRPTFVTDNAGDIDLAYTYGDWYLYFTQAYKIKIYHSATFDSVYLAEIASALDIDDLAIGNFYNVTAAQYALQILTCNGGGTVTNCNLQRMSATQNLGHAISCTYSKNITISHTIYGLGPIVRGTGMPLYMAWCSGFVIEDCYQLNGYLSLVTCKDITVTRLDHTDTYCRQFNAAIASYVVVPTVKCNNVLVDTITFGFGGLIADQHPYTSIFYASASDVITFRNLGTRGTFGSSGATVMWANYYCATVYATGGNNSEMRCQRLYYTPTRTGLYLSTNSDRNVTLEDCYGDMADTSANAFIDSWIKGCGMTNIVTGSTACYGTHVQDLFTSDTTGRVVFSLNEATTTTTSYITTYLVGGSKGFTSAGSISLTQVNDYVIIEQDYFALGHTAFANIAPTLTGTNTGNHTFQYQLKTTGDWGNLTTLSAANLINETISASTGFKLRLKITCATAATTNVILFVRIDTVSTLAAQTNNLYPLDTYTLTLTGLQPGSEVRCYTGSTPAAAVEIGGIESNPDDEFILTHSSQGVAGYIVVFSEEYQAWRYSYTYLAADTTIPVQQIYDRQYYNP